MLKTEENYSLQHAVIFNTLRILKRLNPADTYLEAYLGHLKRSGASFFDSYMLLWEIAASRAPKKILEIGTRTGISLCQLLSGYIDNSVIEEIVCIDPFNDGFISPALVKKSLNYLNLPADKVDFKVGLSQDVLPGLITSGRKFDYILVDGDHSKITAGQDLEAAHELLETGGIIVFDDISDAPGECALIDVWKAFEAGHEEDYEFNHNMSGKGTAWAIKK